MNWERNLSLDERDFLNQIKNYRESSQEEKLSFKVLKLIFIGGFVASCLLVLDLAQTERLFMLNDIKYCRRIYQIIRRLETQGMIYRSGDKFYLTHKGRLKVNKRKIIDSKLKFNNEESKRLLILFDIPESKGESRKILRDVLLRHGCKQVQKSVYISNQCCKASLKNFSKILDIDECVVYFHV